MFLSTKVLADTIADAEKSFSRSLRRLKTDFVDLVYFHQLGDHKPDEARGPEGVYTWLLRQKKAGKTRFVGVSGHNRPGCFPSFLEPGDVDVILVVINLVDRHTYGFEDKVVPIARQHKVGIVAMKAFGGSCGGNYPDPKCPPMLDLKHLDLAVRYTLSVPGVATVNIGVHNVEQLRKNVAMVKRFQPLSSEEQARCLALGKELAAQWSTHLGPLAQGNRFRLPLVY